MKIRLIGAGYPFCRHPLIPTTLLVQTSDGGNLVVNCPAQISAKLESISMSLSDIDVWVLTSASVSSAGGLEELANTQTKNSTTITAITPVMDELRRKYEMHRGSNKKLSEVQSSSLRLKDEHYDESVIYRPGSVIFDKSKIIMTDIYGVAKAAETAELILCNVMNGSSDLSVEFEYLREFPLYTQAKIWLVGYGNSYQTIEDPFPIMFMPQGTCVFDSDRKDRYISKERFILNDGKRAIGNRAKI